MKVRLTNSIEDVREKFKELSGVDYAPGYSVGDEQNNILADTLRIIYLAHVGMLLRRIDGINAATQD